MPQWTMPLLALIVFEGLADVLAKEWSLHGHALRWVAAIGGYVLANIFWLFALRGGAGLTRGAMIFSVGSAVLAVFIGSVLYRESLTKLEIIGTMLGLVALVLIFWNGQ